MYLSIWDKILSKNEEVEYEFSISLQYRLFGLFIFVLISLAIGLFGLFLPAEYLGKYQTLTSLIIVLFSLLLFIFALFYFLFYMKIANVYAFTNRRVLIHRGWLSTSLISINYENITDVTVKERFFEKLITNTGNIIIDTAGTSGFEVVLASIANPYEVAKRLDNIRQITYNK